MGKPMINCNISLRFYFQKYFKTSMLLITNSGETGKNFSSGWSQMTGAHFSVKSRASLLTSPATKLSMNVVTTNNIENKVNFIVNNKVTTD